MFSKQPVCWQSCQQWLFPDLELQHLGSAICTCLQNTLRIALAKLPVVDVVGLGIVAVVAAVPWVVGWLGVRMLKKGAGQVASNGCGRARNRRGSRRGTFGVWAVRLCYKSNGAMSSCQQPVWMDLESMDL